MRVSVVITNYDYERYLAEGIESALAQSHRDTEVIVVDDGSTDGSARIIERYAGRIVTVMKEHAGQGAAVNAGFAASSGDAVVFMDPDDVLLPDATAAIARGLAEPGVAKLHWPMLVGDERAQPIGELHPDQPLPSGDLRDRLSVCPRYVSPSQSGNAYARWYLEQVLPMPEAPYPAGADSFLYQLVIPFGEVRVADAPLSIYRRHPASMSQQPVARRMARWAGLDDVAWERLASICARQGLPAPVERWRRNSWNHRLAAATAEIDEHVGADEPFVLLDDSGSFGLYDDGRRNLVQWWGPPADGAAACAELEEHRRGGARYAVVGWPAFWWLAYYRELRDELAHHRLVLANERVRIYALDERSEQPVRIAADPAAETVPVIVDARMPAGALSRTLADLDRQDGCRVEVHVVDEAGPLAPFRHAATLAERFDRVVFVAAGVELAPNAVATLLDEHMPGTVGAAEAVRFTMPDGRLTQPCAALERADWCVASALVADADLFRDPAFHDLPEACRESEDVWLSYFASQQRGQRLYRSSAAVHVGTPRTVKAPACVAALVERGWAIGSRELATRRVRTGGRGDRRVAVFRESFLPPSETFIRDHVMHLPTWTPFVLTAGRVEDGLEVPGVPVFETGGGARDAALAAVLRREQPALVHAHFGPDAAAVRAVARDLGLPLVVTFHGYDATVDPELLRSWPSAALLGDTWDVLMDDVAAIITVSRFLRERLVERGADPERISVIPCGVDTDELGWSPPAPDGGIVFVGRLVEKKGCADLLEAASMLPRVPRLRIVGDGPLRGELEGRARSLGLDAEFLGVRGSDDVRAAIESASIVAMPSQRARNGDCEGLPVVSLEASALGRPVVGYSHSGLVESVISGETGLLAPEGDVIGLAANLERLLGDECELQRMSRNARRHVEDHFRRDDCLRRVEEVYESVVAPEPARRGRAPKPDERPGAVCVVGMHRSGTSLTSRILNLLGVDLGPEDDMHPPSDHNSRGYWEQAGITALNDEILDRLGGSWWEPPPMPPGWHERDDIQALAPRAREILATFPKDRLWGWKDPRTSLTLPFWQELVPDMRYVVCVRYPRDVAQSLLRRDPMHTWDSAVALWMRYTAAALEHTAGAPRIVVFYADFLDRLDEQVAMLAEFTGRDVGSVPEASIEEIRAFVSGDLRHHRSTLRELVDDGELPLEVRVMYVALRAAQTLKASSGADATERAAALEQLAPGLWDALAREDRELAGY